jgi:oligo-1,6-glucosidase
MTVRFLPDDRRKGIVYQIYPKSFRDLTADGIGDLRGITQELPYLQKLGVDMVWLSPIFASPMIDNGYDVSDYKAVNPLFGTEDDADELFAEAKKRGLRLILDIALNHTSTAHPWFEAARDPASPYRDWFWFRPGKENSAPPNNWLSIFGGPAWSKAPGSDNFYLHLFDRTQADLNWENPAVRAAIHDAMRFWLERGVGGFRLDVVTVISKDPALPDAARPEPGPLYRMLAGGPRLHEFLREMRCEVFSHYDCIAIGETPGVDPTRAAALVDPDDPMLDLIYHFDFVEPRRDASGAFDRVAFRKIFRAWDEGIGPRGWNTIVLGNHDLARLVSRYGDNGRYWRESATALLTILLTQRGTPFLYQGDELGMSNCPFDDMDELDDVWAKTNYRLARERGADHAEAFAAALAMTRDHARTPMQWSPAPSAGFSSAAPWLRVHPRAAERNVETQTGDAFSPLELTRRLIALRRADALWTEGDMVDLAPDDPDLFAFERRSAADGLAARVLINLRSHAAPTAHALPDFEVRFSNYPDPAPDPAALRPWEARIYATMPWESGLEATVASAALCVRAIQPPPSTRDGSCAS